MFYTLGGTPLVELCAVHFPEFHFASHNPYRGVACLAAPQLVCHNLPMRIGLTSLILAVIVASAQSQDESRRPTVPRSAYVIHAIEQAVLDNPLPAGFKGMMVGYLDEFGPVYKAYGIATVDGTVPMNEKTLFGIGSVTKTLTATLLAIADNQGLPLATPARSLLPSPITIPAGANRYNIQLLDLADHHGGLPKNEGHLYSVLNDLYGDYAADPITCDPATPELINDCGCCDPIYMSLVGQPPTCGAGFSSPVYTCPTHTRTQGSAGWVYSNLGFEVLGNVVATWLGYTDWNEANLQEITVPLNMPDTIPIESFSQSQISRAANHCDPATLTTNPNCQLLDWLPIGNPAGGLFSTASDMLTFLAYNAYGAAGRRGYAVNPRLGDALPIIHQNYEMSPVGGQELAWQTVTLLTGELERWKDGANGPFNSWVAYVETPFPRMIVLLDNSGASAGNLSAIATEVLVSTATGSQF
jgi:CubicO group peptidase (beta-lactamase class C family)